MVAWVGPPFLVLVGLPVLPFQACFLLRSPAYLPAELALKTLLQKAGLKFGWVPWGGAWAGLCLFLFSWGGAAPLLCLFLGLVWLFFSLGWAGLFFLGLGLVFFSFFSGLGLVSLFSLGWSGCSVGGVLSGLVPI